MFTLVSATTLGRSIGAQWKTTDLSAISVKEILSVYNKVFLTLSHPDSVDPFYFDMDNWRSVYSAYEGTITELLTLLGDASLPFVTSAPDVRVKYVKYALGARQGYNAMLTNIGQELPQNYPLGSLKDLCIERDTTNYPETDLTLIHKKCLVTVNGLVHWTEADEHFTYIKDGAHSMRQANSTDFGILSFMDVGNITKIKIDEANIAPHSPDVPLEERIIINVPNVDLENKCYILVVGGYFVFPQDNVFWRNGNNSFALDIKQINYLERYLESRNKIDLSSFNLTTSPDAENSVLLGELLSDFVIKKYLTLSQSFLLIVDVNEMVRNRIYLKSCYIPGEFITYQDPSYPLMVGYGRTADYWKREEAGRWYVKVVDGVIRHYLLSTQHQQHSGLISDQEVTGELFKSTEGYLLQLGGYNTEAV